MNTNLYKKLFNFDIKNDMKISSSNNEIYNQLLLYIFSSCSKNLLILTPNLTEANKLYFDLQKYMDEVYIFPEDDYITKKAIAVSPDLLYMRMKLLNNIADNKRKIVISHTNSFIKKLPNLKTYKDLEIKINKNTKINRETLIKKLDNLGYKRDTLVTNTGDFAIRGYIVDIFPIDEEHPIRIELFDEEVENIKYFDEFTQLSIKNIDDVIIKPIIDEFDNSNSNILDYLDNPILVVQDKQKIENNISVLNEQKKYYEDTIQEKINFSAINNKIFVDLFDNYGKYDISLVAEELPNYNENIEKFVNDIIKNKGTLYYGKKDLNNFIKSKVNIINEHLNKGFVYSGEYYYSINDLKTLKDTSSYNLKYKIGKRISNIDNLSIGDYVVHKAHGIGVYMGIQTITKNGVNKDYILLQYKGKDKLYIPVDNLDKLYKYSSKDGAKPSIQKLNSGEWEKIKTRIKTKVREVSAELIKLYKERSKSVVAPYDKEYEIESQFASEFSFEETPDQLKAINDIRKDLESTKPMDRLLCGDVGYGKTEVIFRAMFKTVLNNKQVMYLCPTTLLSQQQYDSAINRFKNYGVNIEIINRYTTSKKVKEILENLSNGKIDVLFGTHRLLSDDIKPGKLGLLVIDEEQRFGVAHKEKIKKYKNNVHVLSVSATPIPRSLQMSLTGIRDLSLIETAPKNRYPVQTYVIAYDEALLVEAIKKETSRGGQVFVLYNKIKNMDALMLRYKNLMPDISIKYAHGKMNKEQIGDIMEEFYNNKFEVLISTTIIENGIDVPNANTIIVIDADMFGLSQLYQIRGRVGRGNKIAYAYLMYNKGAVLTETAVKRLNSIKEFTQLGSGYKISMRDLSIRGAGDILGTEQAGFIDSVGVDLYLELINEELNGKSEETEEIDSILIDDVDTHISEKYTSDDALIIELHEKINSIDSIEKYTSVKEEIEDRFGFVDEKIENYMTQELIEKMLKKLNIVLFNNDKFKISIRIFESVYRYLNIEELFVISTKINTKLSFVYRNDSIIISLPKIKYENHYLYYILELLKFIDKKINK